MNAEEAHEIERYNHSRSEPRNDLSMSELSVSKPGTLYGRAHAVFRGTYFQAVLLGLISFTQPGIWTAMNSVLLDVLRIR